MASTKLNQLREEEIQHRETFIRRHGRAVVADLVPAIANVRPMSIDIRERASNSDESLPDIGLDNKTAEIYNNLGENFAKIIREMRVDTLHRSFNSMAQSASTSNNKAAGKSNIDWENRCIALEFRNAQLKAAIVSDRIGHKETPLAEKLKPFDNGDEFVDSSDAASPKEKITAANRLTGLEQAAQAATAMEVFPALHSQLRRLQAREKQLEARVLELQQGKNEDLHTKIASLEEKLDE